MSRKKLILLGIVVIIGIFLPGYIRLQGLKSKNRTLEKRIEDLSKQNVNLARQIERLKNDPFYIEKTAREKMGISKKGEIIYKIEE